MFSSVTSILETMLPSRFKLVTSWSYNVYISRDTPRPMTHLLTFLLVSQSDRLIFKTPFWEIYSKVCARTFCAGSLGQRLHSCMEKHGGCISLYSSLKFVQLCFCVLINDKLVDSVSPSGRLYAPKPFLLFHLWHLEFCLWKRPFQSLSLFDFHLPAGTQSTGNHNSQGRRFPIRSGPSVLLYRDMLFSNFKGQDFCSSSDFHLLEARWVSLLNSELNSFHK